MYTPNTPKVDPEDPQSEWQEPFPEPQTIPVGWDVSGMISDSVPVEMEAGSED